MGAEHDHSGMHGKRFEGEGGVLPEENALDQKKVVVAMGGRLGGGRHAASDLGLDSTAGQELAHSVAHAGLVDAQKNSDHGCRLYL